MRFAEPHSTQAQTEAAVQWLVLCVGFGFVLSLTGCGSTPPSVEHAQQTLRSSGEELSSEDREHVARAEAELTEIARETNQACGTSLTTAVDWASFAGSEWRDMSMASYCGDTLRALARLCEGSASKAYIQGKLQHYECRHGGPGHRSLAVEAGKLRYAVDFDGGNNEDYARSALIEHL